MLAVVRPHTLEYHYKITCPYCSRTEQYLIDPLELMGVIRVIRVPIGTLIMNSRVMENLKISYEIGEEDVGAPTIVDRECGYYFIPFEVKMNEGVKEVVSHMAKALIDHLCRTVKVRYNRGMRYLSVSDLMSDPRISMCINAV